MQTTKPMSDKDPKDAKQGSAATGRRRKASRPPILDLEAVEVDSGEDAAETEAKAGPDTGEPSSQPSAAAAAQQPKPGAKAGGKSGEPGAGSTETPGTGGPSRRGKPRRTQGADRAAGETAAKASAPSPQVRPGVGMMQLIVASGGGAIMTLIAFVAFQLMNRPGTDPQLAAGLVQLNDKIGALENRLGAQPPGGLGGTEAGKRLTAIATSAEAAQSAATALVSRIDSLEQRLTGATEASDAGSPSAALAGRLRQLEAQLNDISPRVDQALSGLTDLKSGLKTVSDAAGGGDVAASQVRLEALAKRAERVEARLIALDRAARSARARDDATRRRLDALAKSAEATQADRDKTTAALAALGKQLSGLGKRLERLEKAARKAPSVDLTALRKAEKALTVRLEQVDARLARAEAARPATVLFSLRQLETAAASGKPFARELGLLRGMVPGLDVPAALETVADAGIVTVDALRTEFNAIAERIRALPSAAAPSIMNRLMESAGKIVTVRKGADTVVGSQRQEALDQVIEALAAGDLTRTTAAAEALSADARALAGPWLAKVRARLQADEALAMLRQGVDKQLAAAAAAAPTKTGG